MTHPRKPAWLSCCSAFIVLAAIGFFGHQFYLVPMQAARNAVLPIFNATSMIANARGRFDPCRQAASSTKLQKISLPANVDQARRRVRRRNRQDAPGPAASRPAASAFCRSSRKPAPARPSRTRSRSTPAAVHGNGQGRPGQPRRLDGPVLQDAAAAPDSQPDDPRAAGRRGLRMPGGGRTASTGDLDVTMTIEALVLDNAEQRKTLQPEKAGRVAAAAGPAGTAICVDRGQEHLLRPAATASDRRPPVPSVDLTPFIKFDSITPERQHADGRRCGTQYQQSRLPDRAALARRLSGRRVVLHQRQEARASQRPQPGTAGSRGELQVALGNRPDRRP